MRYKHPKRDDKINRWKVSELVYESEDGKKTYEHHLFWTEKDAIVFWEKMNPGMILEVIVDNE